MSNGISRLSGGTADADADGAVDEVDPSEAETGGYVVLRASPEVTSILTVLPDDAFSESRLAEAAGEPRLCKAACAAISREVDGTPVSIDGASAEEVEASLTAICSEVWLT